MTSKVNSVLLIDDLGYATQIHEEMIMASQMVHQLNIYNNAKRAIDFLAKRLSKGRELPNIIMVETQFKKMSCWDFLESLKEIIPFSSKVEVHLIYNDESVTNLIKSSFHPLTKSVINAPATDWEIKHILINYLNKHQKDVA